MSLREYARHRLAAGLPGGTARAVREAIKSGRLKTCVTKTGKIRSARQADVEWAASTKADCVPLTGPTAPASAKAAAEDVAPVNELAAARARREAAAAELAEIDLAEKRGELVEAKDVEARLADVFLRCRTRLLGIPALAREQDPALTEAQIRLLESLLRSALEELAGGEARV